MFLVFIRFYRKQKIIRDKLQELANVGLPTPLLKPNYQQIQ